MKNELSSTVRRACALLLIGSAAAGLSHAADMRSPLPGPGPQPVPGPTAPPSIGDPIPEKLRVQPLPEMNREPLPSGPQFAGCVDANGKPLQMIMDLNLVATATGPFSIQLGWTGPPATYRVVGPHGFNTTVASNVAQIATPGEITLSGGTQRGTAVTTQTAASANGSFVFSRDLYPVLPETDYGFKVEAALPDGRVVCDTGGTKTMPAPITSLQSAFVAPDDIRVGFVLPPFVQELNIYRTAYVEDGRQPPFDKRVLQEVMQSLSAVPVTYGVKGGVKRGSDFRKRVNPGLPPVPVDYSKPPIYVFAVEAIWRDGAGRSVSTRTQINVDGLAPLLGWSDLHTHPMSHLAFGGKIFHGAPDVGSMLPARSIPGSGPLPWDCDPTPGQRAATMQQALQDDSPTHGDPAQSACGDVLRKAVIVAMEDGKHLPQPGRRLGAPVFDAWPSWNDIAHQKMWVDWLKRAYDGGLRVMVALSHNNRLLAELAKGNCSDPTKPCLPTDDQASSDLQIMEIKSFVSRNSAFMEVALTPADVYRIVRGNPAQNIPSKMAVVLGVEIDNIGNFRTQMPPTAPQISAELARLHSQGVRYVFPLHISDNVFGGTAPYSTLFNAVNAFETGHFWEVECAATPPYPNDDIGYKTPNWTALDDLNRIIPAPFNNLIPKNVPMPKSPQNCAPGAGHRNLRGLNYAKVANPMITNAQIGIGEFAIKEMMRLGMIIDIDHMSHRTAEDVLTIAESVQGGGYPVMSGHSGIRDLKDFNAENSRTRSQLGRIGCLGGMFGLGTDHAEARRWASQYQDALQVIGGRPPECLYKDLGAGPVALGTDINSLVETPTPGKFGADPQLNVYTAQVNNQSRFPTGPSVTGGRVWDFSNNGVAHYGMFADFIKTIWTFPLDRNRGMFMSGQELVEGHLDRSADNFWHMWVKVEQQKNNVRF
jgi:hypothetical protein